jgi:hypothetical protein
MRYYKNAWSSWYTIPNPTNELMISMDSTRDVQVLYNGTRGRYSPTNKYNYSDIPIKWDFISSSNILLLNESAGSGLSLKSIVSGGYKVEFATHVLKVSGSTNVSQVWQGYIKKYDKNYLLGMYRANDGNYETFYDLSAELDVISIV